MGAQQLRLVEQERTEETKAQKDWKILVRATGIYLICALVVAFLIWHQVHSHMYQIIENIGTASGA